MDTVKHADEPVEPRPGLERIGIALFILLLFSAPLLLDLGAWLRRLLDGE